MSGLLRAPFEVVIECHCLFKVWEIESHLELPRIHQTARIIRSRCIQRQGMIRSFPNGAATGAVSNTLVYSNLKGTAKLGISSSSSNGGFLKWGYPQIINLQMDFPLETINFEILRYPHFRKPPFWCAWYTPFLDSSPEMWLQQKAPNHSTSQRSQAHRQAVGMPGSAFTQHGQRLGRRAIVGMIRVTLTYQTLGCHWNEGNPPNLIINRRSWVS